VLALGDSPGRGGEGGQPEQDERDHVHAGAVQADTPDDEQLGVQQVEHEADATQASKATKLCDSTPWTRLFAYL
jgi:hypothetical protein